MPTERESADVRKAMAFDLLVVIKENKDKTYTAEDLEQLILAYIAGLNKG